MGYESSKKKTFTVMKTYNDLLIFKSNKFNNKSY